MRFYKSRPPEDQGPELDERTAFIRNFDPKITET